MRRPLIARIRETQFWTFRTTQTRSTEMCAGTQCQNGTHGRALSAARQLNQLQKHRIAPWLTGNRAASKRQLRASQIVTMESRVG